MTTRRLLVSVLPLALLASSPALHSDVQPPKVEISLGFLVRDTTCPKAQHALAAFCPYLDGIVVPGFYLDFPGNKNVDRWVGHNVRLRGTMEFTDCSLPLMHVTNIAESTGPLPPCPGLCQPGDPPPCP